MQTKATRVVLCTTAGCVAVTYWALAAGPLGSRIGTASSPPTSALSKAGLPIAVDGAKTPDRIPDRIAYYHFILANAESHMPSALEVSRRHSLIAEMGLDDSEAEAFALAMRGVRDDVDFIEGARGTWTTVSTEQSRAAIAALRTQHDRVLDDARARLVAFLSPEGQRRLGSFVQDHVKKHIVIYGDPPK